MSQVLTGVEYLGCTYDIYGYYARANSVNTSQRLFTLPDSDTEITVYGSEYSYPKEAVGTPALLYQSNETISSYESTEDLYTELSVSADLSASDGLFSAETSAKYSESHTSSSYFYHVEKLGYVNAYKLTLDFDYALNHLDEDFKDALYNMNATDLVEKYGTHFLYEGIFGGRWSYSQSVSKFSYSTSLDAEVKVDANYSNYSASISVSSQTDKSQSSSQSNGEFKCIGGTPDTLVDGFDEWAASVSGNFVLVDFTPNSLLKISELVVNDEGRKKEINNAISAALSNGTNSSRTTLATSSDEVDTWTEGSIDEGLEYDKEAEAGYVMVGFGGRVDNKKGDFSHIAVCYLNLATAERQWKAYDMSKHEIDFNKEDYETFGEVPDGCVLTGIGLKGSNQDFKGMVLYYQELTPASPTNNYLDTSVQSIAFQRTTESSPEKSYKVHFRPSGNEGLVITGIGVSYRKKSDNIQRIKLYRRAIVETT